MAYTSNEANHVVIEVGSHTTRATKNTIDPNQLPAVILPTRVGILKTLPTADAGTSGEQEPTSPPSYIFGDALAKAGPDELAKEFDLLEDNRVTDWGAFSAFCKHILVKGLGVSIPRNQSAVVFSIPVRWPKVDLELLTQLLFEQLNVPALMIVEQPSMVLYGDGDVSGLVVDIGHNHTTITPIFDSNPIIHATTVRNIGGKDVDSYLTKLIKNDAGLTEKLGEEIPAGFVKALKESGIVEFEPTQITEQQKEAETVDFDFQGEKYPIGRWRYKAPRALLEPKLARCGASDHQDRLVDLIKQSVLLCETSQRVKMWESIHLVGGSSRFKGLAENLEKELQATVLASSELFADSQCREPKFKSLPDYFHAWKNHGYMTSFLGAMIISKVALGSPSYHITKVDYNDHGPSIIHTKQF